jgi:hypothetical protein
VIAKPESVAANSDDTNGSGAHVAL